MAPHDPQLPTRQSLVGTWSLEIASVENWVDTDLVRRITVERDRITLTTPPMSLGGTIQTTGLVWERITPAAS